MKKWLCGLLTAAMLLSLSACQSAAVPSEPTQQSSLTTQPTTQPATTAQTTVPTETLPPEPVFVHENAVEDFLLPLEEFSWERKYAPEFVMIHFTSAVVTHPEDPHNIAYIRDIFVEYDLSIHYIIERDGTVHCYIPEDRVAWHAGAGEFAGDPKYTNNMNQYAIGIELAAMGSEEDMSGYLTKDAYRALDDALKGFTQEQYDALKILVTDLCQRYGIPMDRDHVIGHEEYSSRKTDPGELFDWRWIIPDC